MQQAEIVETEQEQEKPKSKANGSRFLKNAFIGLGIGFLVAVSMKRGMFMFSLIGFFAGGTIGENVRKIRERSINNSINEFKKIEK